MKTAYKTREYETGWWKQRSTPLQVSANQAIKYFEAAAERLKVVRDQPVQELMGTSGVTEAGYAIKHVMTGLAYLWDQIEPSHVPPAEPGVYAEVLGARLYQQILQAKGGQK
jgi:hypothetical protein